MICKVYTISKFQPYKPKSYNNSILKKNVMQIRKNNNEKKKKKQKFKMTRKMNVAWRK